MLVLAPEYEEQELFSRLKDLYALIQELSAKQLELVQQHASGDEFMDAFQLLAGDWTKIQAEIVETEKLLQSMVPLDRFKEIFSTDIATMAYNALSKMEQTSVLLKETLRSTGSMIRSANEHRQASKAYSISGYDDHTPIFFDEKK